MTAPYAPPPYLLAAFRPGHSIVMHPITTSPRAGHEPRCPGRTTGEATEVGISALMERCATRESTARNYGRRRICRPATCYRRGGWRASHIRARRTSSSATRCSAVGSGFCFLFGTSPSVAAITAPLPPGQKAQRDRAGNTMTGQSSPATASTSTTRSPAPASCTSSMSSSTSCAGTAEHPRFRDGNGGGLRGAVIRGAVGAVWDSLAVASYLYDR